MNISYAIDVLIALKHRVSTEEEREALDVAIKGLKVRLLQTEG